MKATEPEQDLREERGLVQDANTQDTKDFRPQDDSHNQVRKHFGNGPTRKHLSEQECDDGDRR